MQIVLYDGDCGFCNRSVTFIWKRDSEGIFYFCKIQSEQGRALLEKAGEPKPKLDTFYLIENEKLYERSEAALRVGRQLPYWHIIAVLFQFLPLRLRDRVYDWVAHNRHRLAGKTTCELPPENVKARFLDTA